MISLMFSGMCENCECADLKLECTEYSYCGGSILEWSVRCIHSDACNKMEDRVIERLRGEQE